MLDEINEEMEDLFSKLQEKFVRNINELEPPIYL